MLQKINIVKLDFVGKFEYNKLTNVDRRMIMGDIFEKKLKSFLPYIIIIGAVFLFFPIIFGMPNRIGEKNQLIFIGIYPLLVFLCGVFYAHKKTNDFYFSLIAPVMYLAAMAIYGGFAKFEIVNNLIYLVSYFICGYIGLTVGDMIAEKMNKRSDEDEDSDIEHKKRKVPQRVSTTAHEDVFEERIEDIPMPERFEEVHDINDEPETTYSDDYDLDSILAEIHNRREE